MAEKSAQLTVCARERDKSFARLAFCEASICQSIAVKSAGRAGPGKAAPCSIAALKVEAGGERVSTAQRSTGGASASGHRRIGARHNLRIAHACVPAFLPAVTKAPKTKTPPSRREGGVLFDRDT